MTETDPSARIPVAILGATGTVGQKFVRLLADHPWFRVSQLAASDAREGRRYGDEVRWREPTPLPREIADLPLTRATPDGSARIAFSALDATVAREVEPAFARAGILVVSNASAHRMDADVPLLIPEVNAAHLALLEHQRTCADGRGDHRQPQLFHCGSGYCARAAASGIRPPARGGRHAPGRLGRRLSRSVIPRPARQRDPADRGEEEKIEQETRKLLGALVRGAITDAEVAVSAMVHRVPVVDGHLVSASLAFERVPSAEGAMSVLESFRGAAAVTALPSSPARPVEVDRRADRPQSRLDADRGAGMTVTVGRVRPCPINHLRMVALGTIWCEGRRERRSRMRSWRWQKGWYHDRR